jgi:hypothetical protein
MHRLKYIAILITLTGLSVSAGQQPERYSAANVITFNESGETRNFVGSGFLLQHNKSLYAVTAKHVLLAVMDQGIHSIDPHKHISHWQLQPFNESTGHVTLGQLLNADPQETLDIKVLQDDWLVFEVAANESGLQPVTIADHPLKAGETVHVYGCYYSNQDSCQQEHISGEYVSQNGVNLLIRLDDHQPGTLRGLSGAPVLNDRHEVVGIVSNVMPDDNGELLFAPFTIQPVLDFLKSS